MNARLVQTFAVLAAVALAMVGGRRFHALRRLGRSARRTVSEDVEALFI